MTSSVNNCKPQDTCTVFVSYRHGSAGSVQSVTSAIQSSRINALLVGCDYHASANWPNSYLELSDEIEAHINAATLSILIFTDSRDPSEKLVVRGLNERADLTGCLASFWVGQTADL